MYTQQISELQTSAGDMQEDRTEAMSQQNYAVEKSTVDMEFYHPSKAVFTYSMETSDLIMW
jgi:hypothetical protein